MGGGEAGVAAGGNTWVETSKLPYSLPLVSYPWTSKQAFTLRKFVTACQTLPSRQHSDSNCAV